MNSERNKGPNYPPAVRDTARRLFVQGMRPSAIAKELERLFPDDDQWPGERTVRNWAKVWGPDQSGPWAFDDVGDAAILLPILRDLIDETGGRVTSLTQAQAELLSRLSHAVQGMPAVGMYNWVQAMISARVAREPLGPLFWYLAYRPWTDVGKQYRTAADKGLINELRAFCPGDEAWLRLNSKRTHRSITADAVFVRP